MYIKTYIYKNVWLMIVLKHFIIYIVSQQPL